MRKDSVYLMKVSFWPWSFKSQAFSCIIKSMEDKLLEQKSANFTNHWLLRGATWAVVLLGVAATFTLWVFSATDSKAEVTQKQLAAVPTGFDVQGVSLSQNNGFIDFANLADNDIQFAYFRSTTGNDFLDDAYLENVKRAHEDGLQAGALLVFDNTVNGNTQAAYFINQVGDNIGQLPIMIAVGDDQISEDADKDILANLISSLSWHYGRDVMIAATPKIQKALSDRVKNTKYWLLANNLTDKNSRNAFIQYEENHIIGTGMRQIVMPTSVFNGTTAQWQKLLNAQK